MRLLDAIYGTPWAITPEALTAIIALAEREDVRPELLAEAMHFSAGRRAEAVQAVSAQSGKAIDKTTTVTRRGTTAIVPVVGPIVRYASMFSDVSGGVSVETLARDLKVVLDDPTIEAVLLHVDSPGGEVNGIAELSDMLYAARAQKPIWAYVSDLGASAGYWLASSASQVITAETAALGSIGAVMAVRDPKARKTGQVEFVSSVSPNKRPDPTTQSGKDQLQGLVDALGTIFVEAVARNRGVSPQTVLDDFGGGGLLVGAQAVEAGLADRRGSFEATLVDLANLSADRARPLRSIAAELVVTPTRASTVRVAQPRLSRRPSMSSLREVFLGLFDRAVADGVLVDATADQEASIVIQHLDPPPHVAATTASASGANIQIAPPPPTAGAQQPSGENEALARELASLKAENRRLRYARINEAAKVFADRQFSDLKALPPELPLLTALMIQAMSDDEAYGAVTVADGTSSTRQALVESAFAARQSRKELISEIHNPGVLAVLAQQATSRQASADAEPSAEREAELLASFPAGRQILDERRAQANGHSR